MDLRVRTAAAAAAADAVRVAHAHTHVEVRVDIRHALVLQDVEQLHLLLLAQTALPLGRQAGVELGEARPTTAHHPPVAIERRPVPPRGSSGCRDSAGAREGVGGDEGRRGVEPVRDGVWRR